MIMNAVWVDIKYWESLDVIKKLPESSKDKPSYTNQRVWEVVGSNHPTELKLKAVPAYVGEGNVEYFTADYHGFLIPVIGVRPDDFGSDYYSAFNQKHHPRVINIIMSIVASVAIHIAMRKDLDHYYPYSILAAASIEQKIDPLTRVIISDLFGMDFDRFNAVTFGRTIHNRIPCFDRDKWSEYMMGLILQVLGPDYQCHLAANVPIDVEDCYRNLYVITRRA